MPTLSSAQDDIRYLAGIDTRHRGLADVSNAWFERMGLVVLSERAPDETPLVAVSLKYDSPCPIDPTATVRIKHWVANLDRPDELLAAFSRNIIAINEHMAMANAQRVWGAVPKEGAEHMISFLDRVAEAGACNKIDGAGIPIDLEISQENDLRNFWLYVGDGQRVTDAMEGR